MKRKIILASTSPRRHGLAQQMGLEFEIMSSNYEEDMSMDMGPDKLAMTLAYGKAKDVADRLKTGVILGVDTFIVFEGKKLGKTKTEAEARKLLRSYSGKELQVYSGVALIDCETKQEIQDNEVSHIKFKEVSDEEIESYIKTGEPLNFAGSIVIQGLGSVFIEEIRGCYANIVGFPINNIYKNLKKLGVNIFEYEQWSGK